jgi:hypothetical protein
MKNESERKPRNERILVTTQDEVSSINIGFDPVTGKIHFDQPVINSHSEVAYDRTKGEKIVSKIPLPPDELRIDPHAAIESAFDLVFAVDTNTKAIRGETTSVTGIMQCQKIFIADQSGMAERVWQYFSPIAFAFTGARDPIERAGWALAIEQVHNSADFAQYERIGIIVDAYLGDLPSYNTRKEPIVPGVLLPERFSLLYASADTGGEYFANQMLSHADRIAKICLAKIDDGTIVLPQRKRDDLPFEKLLHIHIKDPRGAN